MNELMRRMLFLPEQASNFSTDVDHLHYFVILTTLVMSFLVGVTALYFFWRYRQRSRDQLTPDVQPGPGMEVMFVVLPLVFFVGWGIAGFRDYVRMQTPPKDAMDVYVMAKQWMWKFSYPEGPSSLSVLRVPTGRPVRLLLTSRDVIHSFFVPAFRLKRDAVPGRYTQMWFVPTKPGRYPIFCAEYCGLSHSNMTGEVVAMDPAEFDAWLADQRTGFPQAQDSAASPGEEVAADASLVEQGRAAAVRNGCLKCHSVDGSPHIGPTWLDLYGRTETMTTGEKILAEEAYLTQSMMDPLAYVVAGFQPVMPSFMGLISPAETAALLEYIKSLRSDRRGGEDRFRGPLNEPAVGQ